jgi:hypothetical protein
MARFGRLRAGALIVADNADDSLEYLARVRSMVREYIAALSSSQHDAEYPRAN